MWYDLMTTDQQAAVSFYNHVIGWGTRRFGEDDPPYLMWTLGETPIGGVMEIDEASMGAMPPSWTAYVTVPDIDDAADRIQELGGKILSGPMEVPEVGRVAVASDPQGAAFAIFTPDDYVPGHDGTPKPGEFSWHELATTDPDAAFDFYADLFGWEKTSDFDMGDMGLYQMYGQEGREYGGMFEKPDDMPGPPFWLYYAHVSDLDAAVQAVTEHGGQVLNGPMEVPGGDRVATCADPQGAVFALHAR